MRTIWVLAILLLGALSVRAATINVPADQATITAAVTAAVDGDIILVQPANYAESVDLNKNITLRLAGAVTINGSLAGIAGATIDLQSFVLTFGNANASTCASTITGSGSVVKTGTGTVALSGNSNFSGGLTSNNGILDVTSNNALGTGTFTQNSGGTAPRRFRLANGVTIPNNVVLNGGDPQAGQGLIEGPATGSATVNGTITVTASAPNGGIIMGGTGLVLNGAVNSSVILAQRAGVVTYNGGGTITGFSLTGTATIANVAFNAHPLQISVSAAATLNLSVSQEFSSVTVAGANTTVINVLAGTTTLQGNLVLQNAGFTMTITGSAILNGNLTQTNNQAVTINGAGTLDLGGAVRTFNLTQNTTTISANIINGGIQKDGGNTLVLSGTTNTYALGFTLNGGFVRASSNSALGTGTFTMTNTGKRLLTSPNVVLANPIVLNGGTPDAGNSAIEGGNAAGTATMLTGGITITAPLVNGSHFRGSTAGLNIACAINSTVPILQQAENVTYSFAGGGTYPEIQITGTALIGANDGLSPNAIITIAMAGTGQINAQTFTQNYSNGLNLGNPLGGSNGGTATLTSGTGSNILNANPTSYGNFTHVVSGNLNLGGVARTLNVNDGTSLSDLTLSAVLSNGVLVKNGAGYMLMSGAATNAQSATQILGGTLSLNNDAFLGTVPGAPTPGNLVIDNGTLEVTGALTINANRGIAIGPSTGTGSGSISVSSTNTVTYSGIIANNGAGTGNLVKTNTGILALGGVNTYSGSTTVTGNGRLRLTGDTGSIAASTSINVDTNSALEVDATGTANPDRIGNTTPLNLNDGIFYFAAPATAGRNETLGDLTVNGDSQITVISNTAAGDAQVTVGTISIPGKLMLLRLGVTTAEHGNLFSSTAMIGDLYPNATVVDGNLNRTSFGGIYSASGVVGDGVNNATTFISNASGAWSTPATWIINSGFPGVNDLAIIQNNHNVSITSPATESARGVIFNSTGTISGQISGTGALNVGDLGITVNATANNAPTISCALNFTTSAPVNLFSTGDLTVSGALTASSPITLTLTGLGRLVVGSNNTAGMLAGTLTGGGAGKFRVEDQAKLQFNCNLANASETSLQNIEIAGLSGPTHNLRTVRIAGIASSTLHFQNVTLQSGAVLSVDEDTNVQVRLSTILAGNATLIKNAANADDIDLVTVTSSPAGNTLTLTGEPSQTMTTTIFGHGTTNEIVGTGATINVVRSTLNLGSTALTTPQVLNGSINVVTPDLGTAIILVGHNGVAGTGLSGSGGFLLGNGREIDARVDEAGAVPNVNSIPVSVEVLAGSTVTLRANRGIDTTPDQGDVRFRNVRLNAGSILNMTRSNAQRLAVDLVLLGNATVQSQSSGNTFVAGVDDGGGGYTLTVPGANQIRFFGPIANTATVDYQSTSATDFITSTNLGVGTFSMAANARFNYGSNAQLTVSVNPVGGSIDMPTGFTGLLFINAGVDGLTNLVTSGVQINVANGRMIRGIVNEVATGNPALVNTIAAQLNVTAGATITLQTDRSVTSNVKGWVRFSNIRPGANSIVNIDTINDERILTDFVMSAAATVQNNDGASVAYIGNVSGTGVLTSTGTQVNRFVGTLSGSADLVASGTNTSASLVLQDTGTELTPQLVGTLGGRTLHCLTNQLVLVRRSPGAGTIELPNVNTGELQVEVGRTGAGEMMTSATIVNTQSRTVRGFVEDDAATAKTNTVGATINILTNTTVIADRIGTDTTLAGTVVFANVTPVNSVTVNLSRTNDLNCLADIVAPTGTGAFVSTAVTANARVRNVMGAPANLLSATDANIVQMVGTTTATVGAETGSTLRIVKASPIFTVTTGTPGIYLNGGTVELQGTGSVDVAETVGTVTANITSILALTPTATSDARLTAASIVLNAGASLRYNRNTVAPNTSNFIVTGTPAGTPFPNVHISAATGGSAYSTVLEGGFEEGLVLPKVINNFLIAGPGVVQVGETAMFTVTARDSTNTVIPSFGGTVSLSISAPAAITVAPNPYAFVPGAGMGGDAGVHTFAVRFDTGAGASHLLTVSDDVRSATLIVQVNRGTTSVNWSNPTITYGDPLTGGQLNATGVNLSGNAVPGTYNYTPTAGGVPNAGTSPLNVTFTPSNLVDYFPSSGSATLTVLQKALVISPDNITRNYGQPNNLTATLNGLVNGDDINDLNLTLAATATQASVPGTYSITASGATNPNYSITYTGNPATLTVNPAPLTATATTLIARINQPIPPLTVTYTGFVLGQNEAALETQAVLTTTAVQGNPLGDYPITFATLPVDVDGNYAITTVNGIMHIFPPQPLVDSKSVIVGTGLASSIGLTGQSFSVNPLTFSIAAPPANGTVTIVGTNAVYTSNAGYTGSDSFTFRGFDGFDFSVPGTVTLEVKGAPTVTSAAAVVPNPGVAGMALNGTIGVDYGTAAWNWGDGSPASTGSSVSHVYAAPGLYTATVTVTSPEGLVTTTTVSVFVGLDLSGGTGATPPGVTGILIGGAGAGKAQGGSGKISCNYVKREKTYYQGSLGKLAIPETMTQDSLTNLPGVLTIGSGANAAVFQFVLGQTGKGKSTGLPTIEFSIKKKAFKFKAQRSDLTTLTEALGGPREQGVKKGEVVTLLIPVTLQIGDKVYLAMTFQVKYQQINAGGKGSI